MPCSFFLLFFVGKFISDALMVHAGKFAAENIEKVLKGLLSWKTILGSSVGLLLLALFLFVDWRTLLVLIACLSGKKNRKRKMAA